MPTTQAAPPPAQDRRFYGWWVVATAFVTFGLSVGIPYYNLPFFYDYFGKTHGWELRNWDTGILATASTGLG